MLSPEIFLGWLDANTNENNSKTKHPVIHLMPAQKKYMDKRSYGGTMRLGAWNAKVKKGTKAFQIYGKEETSERHRHRYEFNDEFVKDFEKNGLIISARSNIENLAEIIELPESIHPFILVPKDILNIRVGRFSRIRYCGVSESMSKKY